MLVIQYDSEADIQKSLDLALSQMNFEAKMIQKSSDSVIIAIRDQIRQAADQQRAGRQINTEQQKKIDKFYRRLNQDEKKLSAMHKKEVTIRARFKLVLERYRQLTAQGQESDTKQVDQG